MNDSITANYLSKILIYEIIFKRGVLISNYPKEKSLKISAKSKFFLLFKRFKLNTQVFSLIYFSANKYGPSVED